MNPVTHLLVSWSLADAVGLGHRDRVLVTWCGVVPDLDGLGAAIDFGNSLFGRPESAYYGLYHHTLFHGLPAAVLLAALVASLAERRGAAGLAAVVVFHLHLFLDFVGSRGPSPGDLWAISYLSPFSDSAHWVWSGQWPLNSWINLVFTLGVFAYVLRRAVSAGRSPVEIVSRRADSTFVSVLRQRFTQGTSRSA
jgi:inner membrane protein